MDDCVFCKIMRGELPCEKVGKNKQFLVIKDVNPRVKGHSLVIPKKHYETFTEMPKELYQEFLETTRETALRLVEEHKAKGYNIVINNGAAAEQTVPHLHLHILPRTKGDGKDLWN